MPALTLDAAFVHLNRADTNGNGQILGPDPFFDDLFLGAAGRRFVTAEKVVAPGALLDEGPIQTVTVSRLLTDAVAEVPSGPTSRRVPPTTTATRPSRALRRLRSRRRRLAAFSDRYLEVDDAGYLAAVGEAAKTS